VKRYALNKCADTYTGENITGTMEGGINFICLIGKVFSRNSIKAIYAGFTRK